MRNAQKQTAAFFLLLSVFLSAFSASEAEHTEKIGSDELEPYYIDEQTTHLILNLLDEESENNEITQERKASNHGNKKQQPIKTAGGFSVPESRYAQEMIRTYIEKYSTAFGKKNLCALLDEGEPYRFYVRRELKKRGLPPALEYLPVVESEYKTTAVSKSGAKGLWQFMENSISPFMRKTEWIDERLDPWKSTDAALSKLQDNYTMFGDWTLAVAAYNCGSGAMRRILNAAPEKNFWYLAEHGLLRNESTLYIPKLLAIAEIAENGEAYGIALPDISEYTGFADFDYVTVSVSIPLARIARELRMDYQILKKLNEALTKETTPPDEPYSIRFPPGTKAAAEQAIATILREDSRSCRAD